MATAKAERLLNLVIALVNAPRYRTASWIRANVAGYSEAPSEEAFLRTFERDKVELRALGMPLQTDGQDGYRIPPVEFALPVLSFTPSEAAALALAGRLWDTTALARAGSGALRKIREAVGPVPAAAVSARQPQGQADGAPGAAPNRDPVDVAAPAPTQAQSQVPGRDATRNPQRAQDMSEPVDQPAVLASTLLQPRVRTADPAFEPLYRAVRERRAVTFDYRKSPSGPAEQRALQPWGLVSFRGRWYVTGHDQARGERRTFRLSRITGHVRVVGRSGAVRVPPNLDLLAEVAATVERPVDRMAMVRVRTGRAAGLRRSAVSSAPVEATDPSGTGVEDGGPLTWDRLTVPMHGLWEMARRIAGNGPDVVVEEPPDLVEAVIRLLEGALHSAARPQTAPVRAAGSGSPAGGGGPGAGETGVITGIGTEVGVD